LLAFLSPAVRWRDPILSISVGAIVADVQKVLPSWEIIGHGPLWLGLANIGKLVTVVTLLPRGLLLLFFFLHVVVLVIKYFWHLARKKKSNLEAVTR
jgi:hypothetical protein